MAPGHLLPGMSRCCAWAVIWLSYPAWWQTSGFSAVDDPAFGDVIRHGPILEPAVVPVLVAPSLELFPDAFLTDAVEQSHVFGFVLGRAHHKEMWGLRHRLS